MQYKFRAFSLFLFLAVVLSACGEVSTPTAAPAASFLTPTAIPATPTRAATTLPPTPTIPPLSVSRGKIVYGFPAGSISVVNPDGGFVSYVNYVDGGFSPIFSPDGKRLAFLGGNDRSRQKGIIVTNLDGLNEQSFCSGNRDISRLVRWTGDERYVAVLISKPGTGAMASFVCDTLTDNLTELTGNQGEPIQFFDWGLDGKLAIWESKDPTGKFNLFYGEPGNRGAATMLLSQTQDFLSARFSPDGKTLAVIQNGNQIVFLGVPGQSSTLAGKSFVPTVETYTREAIYWLAWSPDGQTMLLSRPDSTHGYGILTLYSLKNQDFGQSLKRLTSLTLSMDWSRQ